MATVDQLTTAKPMVAAPESTGEGFFIQYLPSLYREDFFAQRFLGIFDDLWLPLEKVVASLAALFDPRETPEHFLPWLASWVDLVLDERWPLVRRRLLVREAAELFRWRGTKRGLKRYLEIYTGVEPLIVENTDGIRLGSECRLGLNASLGRRRPFWLDITLPLAEPAGVDVNEVKAIVEAQKPAHCTYTLQILPKATVAASEQGG